MPSDACRPPSGHLPGTLKKWGISAAFGADETSSASLSTWNAQRPLREIRSRHAFFSRPASAIDHIASREGKFGTIGSAAAAASAKTAANAATARVLGLMMVSIFAKAGLLRFRNRR